MININFKYTFLALFVFTGTSNADFLINFF